MPDQRPPQLLPKLESLGITERDWERIRGLVEQVSEGASPPALWDLDARYAVAAVRENPRYQASQKLCVMTMPDGLRVKLIYWALSEHDLYLQGR